MVKAGRKYAALALLLLGLALLGGGVWLISTASGARALLSGISRWSPLTIEVDTLSGRLTDELRLDGVRLRWPGGEAKIPTLHLSWQPRQLFRGEFRIEELAVGEVEIYLQPGAPASAARGDTPQLRWPLVSGWPRHLEGSIAALQIAGVVIHRTDTAAAPHFGPVTLRLDWQDGILRLSALHAQTPYGTVTGEVAAGLITPTLVARLQGELAANRRIELNLDLAAGKGDELLAGPLKLEVDEGKKDTLHLGGEIALTAAGAELRELLFTRSAAAGEVRGRLRYRFDNGPRSLALQLRLVDVDLAPETGVATALSGVLDLAGGPEAYAGDFDLNNRGAGWRDLRLAGHLAGDRQQLALSELDGHLLAGQLGGALHLDWSGPLALTATLQGKNLNPGALSPALTGQINFDLTSSLLLPPDAPPQWELVGRLRESRLRGHPLVGDVDARLSDGDLHLRRLELHGDGIDLTARGHLQERVDFSIVFQRLEGLLPDAGGEGRAAGWLRWQKGELTGVIAGEGKALRFADLSISRAALQLQRLTPQSPIVLRADLSAMRYQNRRFDRLELRGDGRPEKHQLGIALTWPQGRMQLEGAGSYEAGRWSGKILSLEGKDQEQGAWRLATPVTLLVDAQSLRFSPLELTSERGERLEVAGAYDRRTGAGEVIAQWDDLALDRANPWLTKLRLTGTSSGTLNGHWQEDGKLRLQGKVVAAGRLDQGDLALKVQRLAADLAWNEQGLLADWDLALAQGGKLSGKVTSAEKGRLALPQRLTLQVDWNDLESELFAPWIPPAITVAGRLSGELTAELFPGNVFEVTGAALIDDGVLTWGRKKGTVRVALRNADLSWRWQKKTLDLDLALVLADYGRINGKISLPLPALLPVALSPTGALSGEIKGSIKEQGLLSALLPGVLRESHGKLDLDLRLGGSWQQPELAGNLHLSGAGAYLPQAGITLNDLSVQADFAGDRVRLTAFKVSSGEGQIKGEGDLRLQNWQITEFNGTLKGERFLAIKLPELRLVVSPDLTVSGTGEKLQLRGEIKVPVLLVRGRQTQAPRRQHPDVLIVDAPPADKRKTPMALDIEVRVVLGERVLVDFGGIDASLAGTVILDARNLVEIKGRGEIHVVKGSYAAYGMKLNVSRGSLLFAGGPIDQPTLDILALRKTGEIKAGVRVTGTPRVPVVKLYSEPTMADTDVLSYIVLGRPMGSDAGQADLLMVAAGALLAKGESAVLQDRVRRRVGLDVIDIHSGDGDLTTSVVTVGKYLNPKLYISLGHSLFTGTNVVGLRYSISERWQTESTVGEESGIDLFYKIEFQ